MKKSILVTLIGLFFLSAISLFSQQSWDISLGAGAGNFGGLRASYNHLFPKHFSFNIFSNWQERKSPNAPANYNGGLPYYSGDAGNPPSETAFSLGIMGGYTLGGSKVRLNLRAGIAHNNFSEPENFRWVPTDEWGFFGGYHTYDTNHYSTLGFVAEPRVEFLFFKNVGLGISGYTNLNSFQNVYGIGLDLMIGRLR